MSQFPSPFPHHKNSSWNKLLEKKHSDVVVGPGLRNLGQTCYMNSILQIVTHTPPLRHYMMSSEHSKSCPIKNATGRFAILQHDRFCLVCTIEKHIHEACTSGEKVLQPKDLADNLKRIFSSFEIGTQEDAHEFYRYTLDGMQNILAGNIDGKQFISRHQNRSTFLHTAFSGHLRSCITCSNCKQTSTKFDPFWDLSLDTKRDVNAALGQFTSPEKLAEYTCGNCKQRCAATKQLTIDQAPPILTLHIKRFTPDGIKVQDYVQFSEELDLVDVMTKESVIGANGQQSRVPISQIRGTSTRYRLYGVVVHQGATLSAGHYYAFVKARGKWWCMNDSSVTPCEARDVLKAQAYMLFYQRDDSRAPPLPPIVRFFSSPKFKFPCLPLCFNNPKGVYLTPSLLNLARQTTDAQMFLRSRLFSKPAPIPSATSSFGLESPIL